MGASFVSWRVVRSDVGPDAWVVWMSARTVFVLVVGGEWPVDRAAGDLDGDGDLDFVTANRESDNGSVLLNDGMGGFVLSE